MLLLGLSNNKFKKVWSILNSSTDVWALFDDNSRSFVIGCGTFTAFTQFDIFN